MNKISKILLFIIGGLIFSNIAYGVVTQTFVNPIPDANISSSATWNAKITTSSISETVVGIDYNNATGVFSLTSGYVSLVSTGSSTAWNAKQDAITATTPLVFSANNMSMPTSTNSQNGFVLSTDHSLWDSKATSTLTLTAGNGLTGGGDLTADRTFTIGAGTNIVVNADDVQTTSTPAFTKVIFPDTSVISTGYKRLGGGTLIAPSSTTDINLDIGSPTTTSTIQDATCRTTGSNVVVAIKNNGTAIATTTCTTAGNTSSSLASTITNGRYISFSVISTTAYSTTSSISIKVNGTDQ